MPSLNSNPAGRLLSLDYLRGYFVAVIIIDHAWKFPSLWGFFTGEARLWMTAAEGFVIISGFLIGYIRGFKGLKLPFPVIAKKLFSRSLLLYTWMILASIFFVAVNWYMPIVPNIPSLPTPVYDWVAALLGFITFQHPEAWVHFLMLYAIFLFFAIGAVWLLRHGYPWLVALISIGVFVAGTVFAVEWMKWQLIFFIPTICGFYFETIQAWWRGLRKPTKKTYLFLLYTVSVGLFALSVICVYLPSWIPGNTANQLNQIFAIEQFSIARVVLAFILFTALALVFDKITPFLARWTYGVLEYIGTHSLSAYVAHGLILCVANTLLEQIEYDTTSSFVLNTVIGLLIVLAVYGWIKIPLVARILPR